MKPDDLQLFDMSLIKRRRENPRARKDLFLHKIAADEIAERLLDTSRSFSKIAVIGDVGPIEEVLSPILPSSPPNHRPGQCARL